VQINDDDYCCGSSSPRQTDPLAAHYWRAYYWKIRLFVGLCRIGLQHNGLIIGENDRTMVMIE